MGSTVVCYECSVSSCVSKIEPLCVPVFQFDNGDQLCGICTASSLITVLFGVDHSTIRCSV